MAQGVKYEPGVAMLGYNNENYLLRIDLEPIPTIHLGHGVTDRWVIENDKPTLELTSPWIGNSQIGITADSTFGMRGNLVHLLPLVERLLALPPGTTIEILETT